MTFLLWKIVGAHGPDYDSQVTRKTPTEYLFLFVRKWGIIQYIFGNLVKFPEIWYKN